jgi:hypothetical protein
MSSASGSKNKPRKKLARGKQEFASSLLVSCFAYSPVVKMKVMCFSKTSGFL